MPPVSVEEVGLSLVVLSLVFACAALIRRWSSPLRKLFIPTAVIGGFLVLGLGPEGMGRLLGGTGLFPENVFAVWRQLPALLVTVMSASLLLGEHLPHSRKLWSISGSHVIMISVMSFGQFAVGGILVWLLLEPVFGINRKAGALLEMSFNGGHGTVAGLTGPAAIRCRRSRPCRAWACDNRHRQRDRRRYDARQLRNSIALDSRRAADSPLP
jgi:ESS family glutamate:Na+ symporter